MFFGNSLVKLPFFRYHLMRFTKFIDKIWVSFTLFDDIRDFPQPFDEIKNFLQSLTKFTYFIFIIYLFHDPLKELAFLRVPLSKSVFSPMILWPNVHFLPPILCQNGRLFSENDWRKWFFMATLSKFAIFSVWIFELINFCNLMSFNFQRIRSLESIMNKN